MRTVSALAVTLLVVLAGCSAPLGSSGGSTSEPGAAATGTANTQAQSTGATGATSTGAPTASGPAPPDPPSDRLGWENGVWYNQSLSVNADDGLNASERGAVVNRTMARIEVIRQLEYTAPVPVEVISRGNYQGGAGGGASPPFRTFDNAKFEAMFLVGEDEDSLAVQNRNRGSSVLGYYSPRNDSIVVISDSPTPQLRPGTLSHELVHALQDQQFNLADDAVSTREAYNARNGLIEGEGNYVQRRYEQRFDDPWVSSAPQSAGNGSSGDSGSGSDIHYGIYFLEYFPYSDGPGFVASLYERGGWEAVNDAYENIPTSTEQVIYPRLYEEDRPRTVTVPDRSNDEWSRVGPGPQRSQNRPAYAVLGQSALSSMLAYTIPQSNNDRRPVVDPRTFLNVGPNGGANQSDPYNYDLPATQGWDGDKLYVYRNNAGETGYVWKIAWDSPAEAQEFADTYNALLRYWGGQQVSQNGTTSTWRISDGRFADAFRVQATGENVTITNAPTEGQLSGVNGA